VPRPQLRGLKAVMWNGLSKILDTTLAPSLLQILEVWNGMGTRLLRDLLLLAPLHKYSPPVMEINHIFIDENNQPLTIVSTPGKNMVVIYNQ